MNWRQRENYTVETCIKWSRQFFVIQTKPERLDFCLVLLGQSGVIRNSLFMHWILLDHDRDQSTPCLLYTSDAADE